MNERETTCVANDSSRETAGPPMTTHRLWHSAWMGKVDPKSVTIFAGRSSGLTQVWTDHAVP
ncbi:hypothetical protein ALC62_05922 [Cyphomyrmex costatus]|uniref:Uncharacterized protein n=1 Tax=Cyphomyrmex costatus TaxID=456900 RepID=A0A195CT04_9HYME|nr:hypothetical protein ALC62_05922 [Cyphomyrmex costatus]